MSSQGFGRMVAEAMHTKGWSQRRLGAEIGILEDGRIFDSTQVRLIVQGRRRYYDTQLVERLIQVLGLPEDRAWHEAGVWPADLDIAGYRRYRHEMAAVSAAFVQGDPKNGPSWRRPAQRRVSDRRRRDRRRLHLVPQLDQLERIPA